MQLGHADHTLGSLRAMSQRFSATASPVSQPHTTQHPMVSGPAVKVRISYSGHAEREEVQRGATAYVPYVGILCR